MATTRSPPPGTGGARPGQRPGHPCVEFADWLGPQASAGLAQRRGGGHLPVLVPGPKEPQPLDEFAHHLFVGVVEEQRHRQHEVHHDPGRQQAASALGAVGLGQHLVDEIAVHQSGQHAEADPVGQPVRATVSGTRIPVHHRCQSYVEPLQHNLLRANLSPENRYGHHITFSGSTHSTSIEHAVPQQLSPQIALNCNDDKVNGIGSAGGSGYWIPTKGWSVRGSS